MTNKNEPITFNGIPGLDASNNQLTSLNHISDVPATSLNASQNQLTSLEDELARAKQTREFIQKGVEANGGEVIPLTLSESNGIDFRGIPKADMTNHIHTTNNQLTSLKDLPLEVTGELDLSHVNITNLPQKIEGDFDINSNLSAQFHKEFIQDAVELKKNNSNTQKASSTLENIKNLREPSAPKNSNENKPK